MRVVLFSLVSSAILIGISAGCGKKDSSGADASAPAESTTEPVAAPAASVPPATSTAETLPGANAVREAMAKKDYQTAVGGLLALRGAATGDRYTEYMSLYGEVIDTLRAESSTDRKAAEALAGLNAVSRGR